MVDTGGLVPESDEPMEAAIEQQARLAVSEADVILLVTDVRTGITPLDQKAAEVVRRAGKRVIVVANKVGQRRPGRTHAYEFGALGLGEPMMISALKGRNTGDLMDLLAERMPEPAPVVEEEDGAIKVAVVGKPNVGKSSLVNAIVGRGHGDRLRRPRHDAGLGGHADHPAGAVRFDLIDTAGLRRRARISSDIEFYSFTRTLRSIQRCDVAVLLVDAVDGPGRAGAADRLAGGTRRGRDWSSPSTSGTWWTVPGNRPKRASRPPGRTSGSPITPRSCSFRPRPAAGVTQIMQKTRHVHEMRSLRVSTGELNRIVERIAAHYPPPAAPDGRPARILYCTQVQIAPPTFVFFVNHPDAVPDSYRRYLSNRLREAFVFEGSPIRVLIRGREGKR